MPQHIRKGDLVMAISGDDRGRTGRVLRVIPKRCAVVVEGLNIRRKHVKRSEKHPQGGLHEMEGPMDMSNVQPVADGKPTRVRYETRPNGSKVRIAVSTGQTLGTPMRKPSR